MSRGASWVSRGGVLGESGGVLGESGGVLGKPDSPAREPRFDRRLPVLPLGHDLGRMIKTSFLVFPVGCFCSPPS